MTDKDRPAIEQTWRVTIGKLRKEPYCDGIVRVDGMHKHGHTPVVETDSGVYPPSIEQAHLIAAAPEMYRALVGVMHVLQDHLSPAELTGLPVVKQAILAMAKARGE